MSPYGMYERLRHGASNFLSDPFDQHILACIVAIALHEAQQKGLPLSATLGLQETALSSFFAEYFPNATDLLALCVDAPTLDRCNEEECIRQLLLRLRTPADNFSLLLANLIARRSMSGNHLWQDLGLLHRGDLSTLMNIHFAPLARRNHQDMKWKKFFYRMICSEESYSLCAAPVCTDCADFEKCFGDESGESMLARNSQSIPLPHQAISAAL